MATFGRNEQNRLEQAYNSAEALLARGDLAGAKMAFEKLLRKHPAAADARNILGLIALQSGKRHEAIAIFRRAIRDAPIFADPHNNLASVLLSEGKTDEALRSAEMALAIQPGLAEAHNNRGIAFERLGRLPEAEESFAQAVRLRPSYVDARVNLGVLLNEAGDRDRALAELQQACLADPTHTGAALNKAQILLAAGNSQDALKTLPQLPDKQKNAAEVLEKFGLAHLAAGDFATALGEFDAKAAVTPRDPRTHIARAKALLGLDRDEDALSAANLALALQPGNASAFACRGMVLLALKRATQALADFDAAIAADPAQGSAHNGRASALLGLGRPREALSSADAAIGRDRQMAAAHNNRGNAQMVLQEPDDAVLAYQAALAIDPNDPVVLTNHGNALIAADKAAQALASFDAAVRLAPDNADARFNRAVANLLLGRFEAGWADYEARTRVPSLCDPRDNFAPRWNGRDELDGRTILVPDEQGLGDMIQFSRLIEMLSARGARVIFLVRRELRRLLAGLTQRATIITREDEVPPFDFAIPLMSLMQIIAPHSIPTGHIPYLSAEPELVAKWCNSLGRRGFRVGIAWQGRPGLVDRGRSFTVDHFAPLAAVAGVRLISLQKHHGSEQLVDIVGRFAVEDLGSDFDDGEHAFIDTAAVMQCLDLIITSDTAIAHLAGALGRPVWVILKHVPDWRWMLDRPDSPWYPTMRLFRQTARGDWSSLFAHVAGELSQVASAARNSDGR